MRSTDDGPQGPVILLGPQERQGGQDYTEVAQVLDELGIGGSITLITTGWQENECEDDALTRHLGRPTVNLALHARSELISAKDPDFAIASATRQKHLRHLQEFYRVRLDAIDDAASAIAVRHVDPELLEEQRQISVAQFRHIDDDHLTRCAAVQTRFDEIWKPQERPEVVRHRESIAAEIEGSEAIVIAGGHVMSLLNRMRLFSVLEHVGPRPIVAWSAGAMTLTDRVVLFHDSPPFGKNLAQVLDKGLGLCPGVVVLPDMARRVRLDNYRGIRRFARRMAPASCLALDSGSRIVFQRQEMLRFHTSRLALSGAVEHEQKYEQGQEQEQSS